MDHYKLLGIHKTANKDEIKKAYRQLAKRYHPDKNSASNAEEKFRSLNEAYEVLIDDNKRRTYDHFDLPQARANHEYQSRHSSHHKRPREDDRFFTGSSERHSEKQKFQDELDRVRGINSDLLDKANAEIRRTFGVSQPSGQSDHRSRVFMGEIHQDKSDEEYEKIVINRLRSCSAGS